MELGEVLARLRQLGGHEVEGCLHRGVHPLQALQLHAPLLHACLRSRHVTCLEVQQGDVHAEVQGRRSSAAVALQLRSCAVEERNRRTRVAQPRGDCHRDVRKLELVHLCFEVDDEARVQANQHVVPWLAEGRRRHHLLQFQRQLVIQPALVQLAELAQRGREVGALRCQLAHEVLCCHAVWTPQPLTIDVRNAAKRTQSRCWSVTKGEATVARTDLYSAGCTCQFSSRPCTRPS